MQQRRSAGRPTGTDGSDFNYRMVVDSRYQRVADRKSRLRNIILSQAVLQLIGILYTCLLTFKGLVPNVIAISSIAIGSFSLLVGELGRRRTREMLLKVYMVASSVGVIFSIVSVAKGSVTLQVLQTPDRWETHKFELLGVVHTAVGFLIQIFTVSTVASLISNMSPPKRM